ncbi:unnamed protein product [Orchesella dallaii]|uniref:Uncharacterized protein n=1 Tax=Orchesella dallaii TaxID=48710 RepID=A0ABP1RMS6_9HEXA
MESHPQDFTYVTTQILKLNKIRPQGWPSFERLPDIQELVAYGLASVLMFAPYFGALYAIIRANDPINIELKDVLPDVPRRLLAAVVNCYLVFYAGIACSVLIALILAACHVFEKETEANKLHSMGTGFENKSNKLECMLQEILFYIFLGLDRLLGRKKSSTAVQPLEDIVIETLTEPPLNEQFFASLRRHRQLTLLMAASNKNVQVFIPTMTTVGIMLCTIFSYALLTMYDKPEFQFLFPLITWFFVCINIPIIFFCEHASLPLIYTEETIHFWKGKLERRLVNSMQPFGFTLGAFFSCKKGDGVGNQ